MYQKLFQITIVLFLVVVSLAAAAMLITALLSTFSSPLVAHDSGMVLVAGALDLRRLAYMIVAASLVIAGFYLFFRRSRFKR
jgi:hypothetical protein